MLPLSQPAESARQFLISKVLRQADSDGVMLSDFEKQMLDFSEGAASAADIEAVANFDSEHDSDAYEAKIARLLRRAYQHDAKLGQTHQWQDALNALRSEDWYICPASTTLSGRVASFRNVTQQSVCVIDQVLESAEP